MVFQNVERNIVTVILLLSDDHLKNGRGNGNSVEALDGFVGPSVLVLLERLDMHQLTADGKLKRCTEWLRQLTNVLPADRQAVAGINRIEFTVSWKYLDY